MVVVGESLESQNGTGVEHMRYLRAGHSLLGGVWVGPKAVAMEPDLLLQDEAGDKLGDSVYTAFILQEAALLASKAGNDRPKNALIMYVPCDDLTRREHLLTNCFLHQWSRHWHLGDLIHAPWSFNHYRRD